MTNALLKTCTAALIFTFAFGCSSTPSSDSNTATQPQSEKQISSTSVPDKEESSKETTDRGDSKNKDDDFVGVYALQRIKSGNKPAVKIEKEYEDYYLSLLVDGHWLTRHRLQDMSVEAVEEKFGKSAHHFIELAMITEDGTPVYKVVKGMKYDGKVFETAYVLDLYTLQQLRKIKE